MDPTSDFYVICVFAACMYTAEAELQMYHPYYAKVTREAIDIFQNSNCIESMSVIQYIVVMFIFHENVQLLFSLLQSSESVTLDLLTYSDLEALRDKRNGHTNVPSKRPSPAKRPKQLQAKRYLILTYSVEFDRYRSLL